MVARCPEKLTRRGVDARRKQPTSVMTVDADSGSLLLPKTYVTRQGRLVLFADDPLAQQMQPFTNYEDVAAAHDAYVDKLLQDTFNGNLLYLAASILVFGDDVCTSPGSVTDTDTEYRGISKYRYRPSSSMCGVLCIRTLIRAHTSAEARKFKI